MRSSTNRRGSLKGLILVVMLVLGVTQGLAWWRDTQTVAQIKAHLPGQTITMYSTASCYYCGKARAWFRQHDIPWDECDVEQDSGCRATFDAHGALGTPLMRVGSRWHLGFEPTWLAEALKATAAATQQAQSSPSADTSPRP